MGLIKKNEIEDRGTIFLEKVEIENKQYKPRLSRILVPDAAIAKEISAKGIDAAALEIVENARREAEGIKEDAYAEGLKAGNSQVAEKMGEAIETLNRAVKERKKIIKDSEAEILRLAIKVAEQILRSEVSLHRDVCLNMVADAISRISDREQIIVKVNHEDADNLKQNKEHLAGLLDGVKSFSIMEDSSIEPGGCVIETNLGYVDARLATKVKAIEAALKKVQDINGDY